MSSGTVRYERERLIDLLQRDALEARDIHAGQRPDVALLRGRPQGDALGRGGGAGRRRRAGAARRSARGRRPSAA